MHSLIDLLIVSTHRKVEEVLHGHKPIDTPFVYKHKNTYFLINLKYILLLYYFSF